MRGVEESQEKQPTLSPHHGPIPGFLEGNDSQTICTCTEVAVVPTPCPPTPHPPCPPTPPTPPPSLKPGSIQTCSFCPQGPGHVEKVSFSGCGVCQAPHARNFMSSSWGEMQALLEACELSPFFCTWPHELAMVLERPFFLTRTAVGPVPPWP